MKRLYLVLCILLVNHLISKSQDTQFSQFYAAPCLLNPAFAGTSDYGRLVLNYRNQWPELNKAFTTYSAAGDMKLDQLHGGAGIAVMSDVIGAGDMIANQIHFMYSYIVKLDHRWSLSMGIQASIIQNTINWNKLVFPDMIDPIKGAVQQTGQQTPDYGLKRNFADFTAGFALYTTDFYLGFATHHLSQPGNSLYNNETSKLERNYLLQAGYMIKGSSRERGKTPWIYYPSLILEKQGEMKQINYGLYAKKESFVGGLWYRQNLNFQADALIFLAGVYLNDYKVSYSYDLPISSLLGHTYSSHELTIGILFSKPPKQMKMQALPCPDF